MTVQRRTVIGRGARAAIAVQFVAAVGLIIYAGLHDVVPVFRGGPAAVASDVSGTCTTGDASTPCAVRVTALNQGRYRVATTVPAASLTLTVTPSDASRAKHLMVRVPHPVVLRVNAEPERALNETDGRLVVPLPRTPLELVVVPPASGSQRPLVLDEVGLYESADGLTADERPVFRGIPPARYHGTLVPRAAAHLLLFTIVAALFVPPEWLRRSTPAVLTVLCFALCLIDLAILYSPYVNADLRSVFAAGPMSDAPGTNLNGSVWQGFNLLRGAGLTVADGVVPWERMPGYGLFCALGGALFGHASLLDVALSAVILQTIVYSVAVGLFAWAALLVAPPAAVWAAGVVIAWLPKQLGLTQVDAVIAPVALLIFSALCVRLWRVRRGGSVPLAIDALVHASFAAWFALRPDVLPAWLIVALVLHARQRRRLLLPLAFFLAIGISWGTYRSYHHREFSLTTTSSGAGLFCGLFDVPSRFRLAMACTDEAYFSWIQEHTPFVPQSAAASSYATREVLKFWLTYPGHFIVMTWHKMFLALDGDIWPGYPTMLQVALFGRVSRFWIVLALVGVAAMCIAVKHERERTLATGWPLILNAPLFWVLFASLGRFYSAAGVALVAAAVPPLLEPGFYRSIGGRPWRAAVVFIVIAIVAVGARAFDGWLLTRDSFHYWTPWLDPAQSPLSAFK
jgi:hypothetical protein